MARVVLENVSKTFRDGTLAVSSMDLDVADGELLVLVGPSGCGKTTALRMVAGLEDVTDGTVAIGDRIVNDLSPGERDVAMVFQNYALYPHMTVFQNMALSLKIKKLKRSEIDARVGEVARILRLEDLLRKSPRELSGGQRQRVAMGRAIVRNPQAFLMDEPLSNLDAKLRVQMRTEILRIQRELRVTMIYVTHDQTEAMTLGDRVVVMNRGVIQQIASPQVLYRHPANLFVAGFIGSPAMNLVEAKLETTEGRTFAVFGSHRLRIPSEVTMRRPALARLVGQPVILGIRPEDIEDADLLPGDPDEQMSVPIDLREDMGAEVFLHFTVDAAPVLTEDTKDLASERGTEVLRELTEAARERRCEFTARVSPESTAQASETRALRVDARKLHFFDPSTNDGIYDGSGVAELGPIDPLSEEAGAR